MEHNSQEYVNIPIPTAIANKIKEHIKDMEFNTVSEYIVYVLREVLEGKEGAPLLSEDEERQVKATLKKLGYIQDEEA